MKSILITGGSGFIGTNFIELLVSKGYTNISSLDKASPLKKSHFKYWSNGNILNEEDIYKILEKSNPEVVVHFAARTDTLSTKLKDYIENSEGTRNVISAVQKIHSVKHLIITSTQYVYKCLEKPFPEKDDEYIPHTAYGESKVLAEEYTRNSNLNCAWTIVRPANIWGPWHMRYPVELWKIINKGMYIHPGKKEVIRTYGYVKNIVHQVLSIVEAPLQSVDKKTYYLGDLPIDSYVWLNELSLQLTGKKVKRLPVSFFKALAFTGDTLQKIKIPFPLYSERFQNMTEDYSAPTNVTIKEFGVSHPDLNKNVEETINWVLGEGKEFFNYWKDK